MFASIAGSRLGRAVPRSCSSVRLPDVPRSAFPPLAQLPGSRFTRIARSSTKTAGSAPTSTTTRRLTSYPGPRHPRAGRTAALNWSPRRASQAVNVTGAPQIFRRVSSALTALEVRTAPKTRRPQLNSAYPRPPSAALAPHVDHTAPHAGESGLPPRAKLGSTGRGTSAAGTKPYAKISIV